MNIFLIHQYAGNKGDRAVAYAMCNLIKSIDSSINIRECKLNCVKLQ